MKDRTLIYTSLVLSIASLGYAAWVHHQGSEVLAARALRQREAELVRHWAPRLEEAYRGMLTDGTRIPKNPTTLTELLDPLIAVFDQLGDTSGGETNKTTTK